MSLLQRNRVTLFGAPVVIRDNLVQRQCAFHVKLTPETHLVTFAFHPKVTQTKNYN